MHFTDRRIEIDDQRPSPGPGAGLPGVGQDPTGDCVELADMTEGERP